MKLTEQKLREIIKEELTSLNEAKVVYSNNTPDSAAKKAQKEFGDLIPTTNSGIKPYEFRVVKTKSGRKRLAIKSGSYIAHEFTAGMHKEAVLTAEIVQNAIDVIVKSNKKEFK